MQLTLPNLNVQPKAPSKSVAKMKRNMTAINHAKLLTKWVLPDDIQSQLQVYVLHDYPVQQLHNLLRRGAGIIRYNEQAYVPIFSNTTRKDITQQKHKEYLVSYRLPKDSTYGIALVQPKLS